MFITLKTMETEKILSELKSKLGTTQLSDKTLTAYLGQNLPAEGTEPDEAYYEKHIAVLKALQGQYNADVAAQVNAYKASHPKPDTNDPLTPADPPKDPVIAALQAEVEALKKANKEQAKAAEYERMRGELKNRAAELNVTNRAIWDDVTAAIEVAEGSTPEGLLSSAKKAYEAKLKAYIGEGAAPYGSTPQMDTDNLKNDLEAFAAQLRAEGKLPAKEQ